MPLPDQLRPQSQARLLSPRFHATRCGARSTCGRDRQGSRWPAPTWPIGGVAVGRADLGAGVQPSDRVAGGACVWVGDASHASGGPLADPQAVGADDPQAGAGLWVRASPDDWRHALGGVPRLRARRQPRTDSGVGSIAWWPKWTLP